MPLVTVSKQEDRQKAGVPQAAALRVSELQETTCPCGFLGPHPILLALLPSHHPRVWPPSPPAPLCGRVSPSLSKAAELDHHWVAKAWLNDIGLSQYSQAFHNHLVDGRVLNSLMKRDLEKHLNVSKKFHQVSILLGIELLYQVNFSREVRTGTGATHSLPVCPLTRLSPPHQAISPSLSPASSFTGGSQ